MSLVRLKSLLMEYPPLYSPEQMRQHEVGPSLSVAPQNVGAPAHVKISLAQRAPQDVATNGNNDQDTYISCYSFAKAPQATAECLETAFGTNCHKRTEMSMHWGASKPVAHDE